MISSLSLVKTNSWIWENAHSMIKGSQSFFGSFLEVMAMTKPGMAASFSVLTGKFRATVIRTVFVGPSMPLKARERRSHNYVDIFQCQCGFMDSIGPFDDQKTILGLVGYPTVRSAPSRDRFGPPVPAAWPPMPVSASDTLLSDYENVTLNAAVDYPTSISNFYWD